MLNKLLFSENKGTIQSERGLPALDYKHFSVEERDLYYWLSYLRRFSEKVHFFPLEGEEANGSWKDALPGENDILLLIDYVNGKPLNNADNEYIKGFVKRPDIALLLSFLKILENPLKQFQDLTESHKQFYYRKVLGLKEKSAVPDNCHIVLKLHEDTASMTLNSGVAFDGGKDSLGLPLVYKTTQNNVINQAEISSIYTMSNFKNGRQEHTGNFLFSKLIDVANGLVMPENGMMIFGEDKLSDPERQNYPELGFAISSPLLWLEAGTRCIELQFDDGFSKILNRITGGISSSQSKLLDWVDLSISTSEGLVELKVNDNEKKQATLFKKCNTENGIKIELNPLFPPITALEADRNPVLFLYVKAESTGTDYYRKLKELRFEKLVLKVNVQGLKQLKLNNQVSNVDINKPIELFGAEPKLKSKLTVIHPELLVKPIGEASLDLEWLNLPESFNEYYQAYSYYRYEKDIETESPYLKSNKDCSKLAGKSLQQFNDVKTCLNWPLPNLKLSATYLLDQPGNTLALFQTAEGKNLVKNKVELTSADFSKLKTVDYKTLPHDEPDPVLWPHSISLELNKNDFGHQDHAAVTEYFAYQNIKETDIKNIVQVPVPYTPLLNSLYLNYNSSVEIDVNHAGPKDFNQLQLIHPTGKQYLSDSKVKGIVPHFNHDGYLYIALKKMPIPGQVNLFFQLEPIDNSNISPDSNLTWSYLENNIWVKFLQDKQDPGSKFGSIIEDSTNGLLDSGIITFSLPKTVNPNGNYMGGDFVWIRAALLNNPANKKIPFYSIVRGVYSQGVKVLFNDQSNAADHLEKPLPGGSIKGLVEVDTRIDSVEQPYPSNGGKVTEESSQFAVRVSEHLRHKGRALTAWDFEHLILAEFTELHLVRCVRKLSDDKKSVLPYEIDIVVIPKTFDPDMLQPKVPLFLKRKIKRFVKTISNDAAITNIIDPLYESVYFDIRLSIKEGFDTGSELVKLNKQLVRILTPWNVTEKENKDHGTIQDPISLTAVVAFLEKQASVDNVLSIQAYRLLNDQTRVYYSGNIIKPSVPHAVIVPARHQEIKVFSEAETVFQGIGVMEVEYDFIIAQ